MLFLSILTGSSSGGRGTSGGGGGGVSKGTSMTSFGLSSPVPVLRGLIDEDCGAVIAREALRKCISVSTLL